MEDLSNYRKSYEKSELLENQIGNPPAQSVVTRSGTELVTTFNDLILISLDTYLGKNHKFYEPFAEYQTANLEPHQILPDLVTNFAFRKIMPSQDKTLISEMIYYGKLHYLKDLLLPGTPNYQKIGYTAIQEKFCMEN